MTQVNAARRVLTIALLTAAFAAPPAVAADVAATRERQMVDQFYRGRAIMNEAAAAVGGAAALNGIARIGFSLDGEVRNDVQGYRASRIGAPERDGSQRVVGRYDIAGARFHQRVSQRFDSGFDGAFATLFQNGTQDSVRYASRDYSRQENAPSPFGPGGAYMQSARLLPPLLLQRALRNFRSIAWVGETTTATGQADVVEFSFDDATRMRLVIGRAGKRVVRAVAIAPDPVVGDDLAIVEFSGAQIVAGVEFPERVSTRRRGFEVLDLRLTDVEINPEFKDEEFAPPPGFKSTAPTAQQPRAALVAGRVHEVSGLAGGTYQVPFVVMDDFVVAYEAPLGLQPSRQVIAEIRRVAGDKPIRYVVISHFHADHAGGVGAFVEAGATVLSSAENEAVLRTYATANRPQFQGLGGPIASIEMRFEAVPESGYDIVDRVGGKLRVVDFAGTSHVDHMLALHDPASKALMTADHYIEAVRWNATFERTATWVRGAADVDVVLSVHNQPISRTDYLAAAKTRRLEMRRSRAGDFQ